MTLSCVPHSPTAPCTTFIENFHLPRSFYHPNPTFLEGISVIATLVRHTLSIIVCPFLVCEGCSRIKDLDVLLHVPLDESSLFMLHAKGSQTLKKEKVFCAS